MSASDLPPTDTASADQPSEARSSREAALNRVLEYRARGRRRSLPLRVLFAAVGGVVLVVSAPAVILLPEVGVPLVLIALRILAVEAMPAARAYAWIDWRFNQVRTWFHSQPRSVRALVIVVLACVAVVAVWLVFHALS